MCMYVYVYVYVYMYLSLSLSLSLYIYIYVYMCNAPTILFATHLKGATCSSLVSKVIMGPIRPKRPQGPSHPGKEP